MGVQSNLENSFKELWFVTSWLIRELKLQARYFQVKGLLVCVYAPSVGFPGGSVVKNLPANAGDTFDPWSGKILQASEQLGPCATTTKPVLWRLQLLKSLSSGARAPQQEKPLQ